MKIQALVQNVKNLLLLAGRVAELEAKCSRLELKVDSLERQLLEVSCDVCDFESRASNALETLQERVDGIESTLDDLGDCDTEKLEKAVEDLDGRVQDLEDLDIEAAVEEHTSSLSCDLDELKERLEDLELNPGIEVTIAQYAADRIAAGGVQ